MDLRAVTTMRSFVAHCKYPVGRAFEGAAPRSEPVSIQVIELGVLPCRVVNERTMHADLRLLRIVTGIEMQEFRKAFCPWTRFRTR